MCIERLVQRQSHALTIGESGQAVEQRQPRDFGFRAALFGEIRAKSDEALEPPQIVMQRPAGDRPPAVRSALHRRADRIIREGRARRQMEGQRAFGIHQRRIDAEDRGQRCAARLHAQRADLALHLGRQIAQPALAVGLPEPAWPLLLERCDQQPGAAPVGLHAIAFLDRSLIGERQPHDRHHLQRRDHCDRQRRRGDALGGDHHRRQRDDERERGHANRLQRDRRHQDRADHGRLARRRPLPRQRAGRIQQQHQ